MALVVAGPPPLRHQETTVAESWTFNSRAVSGPAVALPRRRLTSYLPVRFAPDVLARARSLAVEDGMSISSWVRRLVEREVASRTPGVGE